MSVNVKICGLTTPRRSTWRSMREPISSASSSSRRRRATWSLRWRAPRPRVGGRAGKVALSVDAEDALLQQIVETLAPDLLQLHGKEAPRASPR